jgi:hypothetical protein
MALGIPDKNKNGRGAPLGVPSSGAPPATLSTQPTTTRTATPAPAAPGAASSNPFGGLFSSVAGALKTAMPAAQASVGRAVAQRDANIAANTPDSIDAQTGAARAVGQGIQSQGQSIFQGQQSVAGGLTRAGNAYGASSQNVRAQPGVANVNPAALGSTGPSVAGGMGAAPGAVSTAGLGGVQNVNPAQLGGYSTVGGQLGGGYNVGSVGNVAGRLGGAPTVGQVGNIQTGAAPGAVAGTFGDQGMSSGDQQSMMARLNGFLDGPEGPSVAEAQLQQAQADNIGQLIGLARSGRGGAGAQAQALQGALSEGGAISSDTAGQMATLRAQEEDMRKNRALSAIGLGGDMATAARGQDLSFRGQNLSAAQGDQSTALGSRGQDINAAMSNQATQTQLEQLRANTGIAARGQDLSALQGDQSTGLGLEGLRANTAVATRGQDLQGLLGDQSASIAARGQNLGALQGNQQMQLGTRGQDIGVLQGNQQSALTARGQNIQGLSADQAAAVAARGQNLGALQGNQQTGLASRGQDIGMLSGNADRNLAAQQLSLQGQLGYQGLANDARGQGLQYMSQANQQALMGEGMAQDATTGFRNTMASINNTNVMADAGIQQQILQNQDTPNSAERFGLAALGSLPATLGPLATILSDQTAKTDIRPLEGPIDTHLRGAPGYRYRYKPGVGEDPAIEHAGPMAQDLERGPFGRALVKRGPDGLRRVDTARLSLVNHAAVASLRSELDAIKAELDARAA